MDQTSDMQGMYINEILFDKTTYCIKSVLPDKRALRDILLRVAVSEAVNQALHI